MPEPGDEQQDLREEVVRLEAHVAGLATSIEKARARDRGPHLREIGCGVFLGVVTVAALLLWLLYAVLSSIH